MKTEGRMETKGRMETEGRRASGIGCQENRVLRMPGALRRAAVRLLGCLALCLAVCAGSFMHVQAAEQDGAAALEGTFGKNGGLRWVMDEETKTVTISGEDEPGEAAFPQEVEYIKFNGCKMSGSMWKLFEGMKNLKGINFDGLDTSSVTNMNNLFSGCSGLTNLDLSSFDTGRVYDMEYMFSGCSGLTNLDLSSFDTGRVFDMGYMFYGCSGLMNLDLSSFDSRRVGDIGRMFDGCSSLTSLDLSGFDTGSVTDMGRMFQGCSSLTSLDLSGFDTGSVTNMVGMFRGCSSLTSLDLSGFDTGNVTDMSKMFQGCSGLTGMDLNGLNIGNVTDMGEMFSGCSNLKSMDLSGLDTRNVMSMSRMFLGCSSLTSLDLSGLDMKNAIIGNMFEGCSELNMLLTPASLISTAKLNGTFYVAEGNDGEYRETDILTPYFLNITLRRVGTAIEPDPAESPAPQEWKKDEDGREYWYENGVRQGYDPEDPSYRGKEIYDPESDAWYWLDNVQQGAKAVSKDVYQESGAGIWAEHEDGTGKWVRYDASGHMVKGWDANENGTYYFDLTYGTMAKGTATIDGSQYHFDENTGVMTGGPAEGEKGSWESEGGAQFWYEGGVRQGYDPRNPAYRGKEIYDPESDAWYWLDNVQQGAKAVSKDVYQESAAGEWAENEDGTGKWVRYDASGHMVKGWDRSGNGAYYFDPTYGTMAKGEVSIDGKSFRFDENTGILAEDPSAGDEWVERLCRSLLADDYKAVMEQLKDVPTVREKCASYEYEEWALWNYETAYRMTAADGTVAGIVVYEYDNGSKEINAFVSYTEGSGFSEIAAGDHFVSMNPDDGTYTYFKGGYEVITYNPSYPRPNYTMEKGAGYILWHV